MRHLFLISLFLTLRLVVGAQQPDTSVIVGNPVASDTISQGKKKQKIGIKPDTLAARPDTALAIQKRAGFYHRFFIKKYPNPRAAALLSFILPGAGQAYNRKYWKIPIVYGALGGLAYLAIDNDREYQRLKKNYKWVVDLDKTTNPIDEPYIYMSATQLKSYRDQFRGYTEKSYLILGITYLLAVTDAFVDAHMARFDVSDDLSMHIVPDIQSGGTGFGASFGIGIKLTMGKKPAASFQTIGVAP